MGSDLNRWIVITGPTASGKTHLAVEVAAALNGEIVSIDSRQVFKHMNLGTGKDYSSYIHEGNPISYHMIDLVEPGQEYHIHRFQQDFSRAIDIITGKGKLPVLCGGSGLYLEAVLLNHTFTAIPVNNKLRRRCEGATREELTKIYFANPSLPHSVDVHSKKRLIRAIEIQEYRQTHPWDPKKSTPHSFDLFIIDLPRDLRRQRITDRLEQRLKDGLLAEARLLLSKVDRTVLERYGLEYKYLSMYLHGDLTYDKMLRDLETAIHRYAKRQMTWFRRMEKQGLEPVWLDGTSPISQLKDQVVEKLKNY